MLDQPPSSVTVLLAGQTRVRRLNRGFRGIDAATDVLSWPAPSGLSDRQGRRILGDVAIAMPIARSQARARGVSVGDEAGMLAIHGTLHLLGYDDERDEDRAQMLDLMNRAAAAAGLPTDPGWRSRHYEGGF